MADNYNPYRPDSNGGYNEPMRNRQTPPPTPGERTQRSYPIKDAHQLRTHSTPGMARSRAANRTA